MSYLIDNQRVFTKGMTNVFNTEIIECPDCGFEFGSMHELSDEPGAYSCPECAVVNLEKIVHQLQSEIKRLKTYSHVEKVAVYDNGISEIHYQDGEQMLVNHVVYSEALLSGWASEECFIKYIKAGISKKRCLVRIEGIEDAVLVDVYWSINLPNNPSFDDILKDWLHENFGYKTYDYDWLTDMEINEIGAVYY